MVFLKTHVAYVFPLIPLFAPWVLGNFSKTIGGCAGRREWGAGGVRGRHAYVGESARAAGPARYLTISCVTYQEITINKSVSERPIGTEAQRHRGTESQSRKFTKHKVTERCRFPADGRPSGVCACCRPCAMFHL
ncbi:hypothetical protein B484DRAFT_92802 [Ochromonadaceae sp. CCMP2298]|nr:hypothetical protein B484DRAFT_92802 [Ochromonadaceae sp. CCMP2298]